MFTSSQLAAYFERIGIEAPRRPTVEALFAVHRAHVDAVPYENLEIQLGRPIRLEDEALFDKIVARRRGGFCYEQNHTLALALEAMGFQVRRVLGGVARETEGDGNWSNHLPLLVRFRKGEYLADAGLGVGFRDPLPLREGSHRVGAFNFSLWTLETGVWRCSIDPRVQDLTFDFRTEPRTIGDFADKCRELSTSPDSSFVKTLTVQRPGSTSVSVLRARTMNEYDPALPGGRSVRVVDGPGEFARLLTGRFGLGLGSEEIAALWDRADRQHRSRTAEDSKASSNSGA